MGRRQDRAPAGAGRGLDGAMHKDPARQFAQRLAASEQVGAYPYLRPRDAATLIIVERAGPTPRLLMGRRHERHVFMPGKFVFPGGRVDPQDSRVPTADDLEPLVAERLLAGMRGRPSHARARGLALAAIRETFEEAGLLIGRPGSSSRKLRGDWSAFEERGLLPSLSGLRYVARAITPPRRPRRFDTRFLVDEASSIAAALPEGIGPTGELDALAWLTLDETFALDLPLVTRTILEELRAVLEGPDPLHPDHRVPFFCMRGGRFVRELL
jgi:8-oxo-dGTP pyrophosphatase MutT (NUDIX family)